METTDSLRHEHWRTTTANFEHLIREVAAVKSQGDAISFIGKLFWPGVVAILAAVAATSIAMYRIDDTAVRLSAANAELRALDKDVQAIARAVDQLAAQQATAHQNLNSLASEFRLRDADERARLRQQGSK